MVKSIPQSGTFIAEIGIIALNGMIEDILRLSTPSFRALVETRINLELEGVKWAAFRRSDADINNMENALANYSDKVIRGEEAVQEDLLFHLAIATASGNAMPIHNDDGNGANAATQSRQCSNGLSTQ